MLNHRCQLPLIIVWYDAGMFVEQLDATFDNVTTPVLLVVQDASLFESSYKGVDSIVVTHGPADS